MILKPLCDNVRNIYTEERFSARILSEKDFMNIDVSNSVKQRAIEGSLFLNNVLIIKRYFPVYLAKPKALI